MLSWRIRFLWVKAPQILLPIFINYVILEHRRLRLWKSDYNNCICNQTFIKRHPVIHTVSTASTSLHWHNGETYSLCKWRGHHRPTCDTPVALWIIQQNFYQHRSTGYVIIIWHIDFYCVRTFRPGRFVPLSSKMVFHCLLEAGFMK